MESTAALLRPARANDAEAIASLAISPEDVRQAAPSDRFPLQARDVQRWLEHERRTGFVLEEQGRIVAYGELNPEPQRAHAYWIGHLMVRDDRRRRGVGRHVVMELLRHGFVDLGARAVRIGAFDDNPVALACYRSCGFREIWRHDVDGRTLVDLELPRSRVMGAATSSGAGRWKLWVLASLTSLAVGGAAGVALADWRAGVLAGAAAGTLVAVITMAASAAVARAAHRRWTAGDRPVQPTP